MNTVQGSREILRTCTQCGKWFSDRPFAQTCSRTCQNKSKKLVLSVKSLGYNVEPKRQDHCRNCGKQFVHYSVSRNLIKYCSDECRKNAVHIRQRLCKKCGEFFVGETIGSGRPPDFCGSCIPTKRICTHCRSEFEISNRYHGNKYCSRKCRSAATTKPLKELTCEACNEKFYVKPFVGSSFCSKKCAGRAKSARKPYVNKNCIKCGGEFSVKPSDSAQKYCSRECAKAGPDARHQPRPGRVPIECVTCKKSFWIKACRAKITKYCSWECKWKEYSRRARVALICKVCKRQFSILRAENRRNRALCSRECSLAYTAKTRCKSVSKISQVFFDMLDNHGLKVDREVRLGRFVIDGLSKKLRVAIEFDGAYWHARESVIEKDERKAIAIAWAGYKLIRVPEMDFRSDPEAVVNAVIKEASTL